MKKFLDVMMFVIAGIVLLGSFALYVHFMWADVSGFIPFTVTNILYPIVCGAIFGAVANYAFYRIKDKLKGERFVTKCLVYNCRSAFFLIMTVATYLAQ